MAGAFLSDEELQIGALGRRVGGRRADLYTIQRPPTFDRPCHASRSCGDRAPRRGRARLKFADLAGREDDRERGDRRHGQGLNSGLAAGRVREEPLVGRAVHDPHADRHNVVRIAFAGQRRCERAAIDGHLLRRADDRAGAGDVVARGLDARRERNRWGLAREQRLGCDCRERRRVGYDLRLAVGRSLEPRVGPVRQVLGVLAGRRKTRVNARGRKARVNARRRETVVGHCGSSRGPGAL